jgi:hypothetical protein
MPWEIRQGTSQCSSYGVFKEGTNQLEGCHESRAAAERQMAALYASENKVNKQSDLYDMLVDQEKALHDSLVDIAKKYGPFDQPSSGIYVGYETPEENEDASIGVKCENCTLYMEGGGCMILSYKVQPGAKCRLAVIPDSKVEMTSTQEEEFVQDMLENMGKADSVRVGQMVSWNSSGGRATGRVTRVIRNGKASVPGSSFSITGTSEDPAALIRIYRNGRPTDTIVGHKVSTLRVVGQKSIWSGIFQDWRKNV